MSGKNPYFQLSIDRNSLLEGVGRRHEERKSLLTGTQSAVGLSNVQKLRERFNKILVGERGPTITVEENK